MADPNLAALERAAEAALGPQHNPAAQQAAREQLLALGQDLNNMSLLQHALDNSMNSYAIVACANALQQLITDNWNSFTEAMRVEIRAFLAQALEGGVVGWGEGPV